MAAYSATLRGASRVFVVDRVPERLKVAESIGCTPIDFSKGDAVDQIIKINGDMVDRSVDAVGYQAVTSSGTTEQANIVLENMIRVTRACGGLGIPGLYVPRFATHCPVSRREAFIDWCKVTPVLPMLLLARV